jgi:hypothetical protein
MAGPADHRRGARPPGELMRALSQRQAGRCENAAFPKCRCRCGGTLHGARRTTASGGLADPHAAAFYDKAELKNARRKQPRLFV